MGSTETVFEMQSQLEDLQFKRQEVLDRLSEAQAGKEQRDAVHAALLAHILQATGTLQEITRSPYGSHEAPLLNTKASASVSDPGVAARHRGGPDRGLSLSRSLYADAEVESSYNSSLAQLADKRLHTSDSASLQSYGASMVANSVGPRPLMPYACTAAVGPEDILPLLARWKQRQQSRSPIPGMPESFSRKQKLSADASAAIENVGMVHEAIHRFRKQTIARSDAHSLSLIHI